MEPGVRWGQGAHRCLSWWAVSQHKQGPGTGLSRAETRGQRTEHSSPPIDYCGGQGLEPDLQSPLLPHSGLPSHVGHEAGVAVAEGMAGPRGSLPPLS